SGCWDVAAAPHWRADRPLEEALDIRANVVALLREEPDHLLHRVLAAAGDIEKANTPAAGTLGRLAERLDAGIVGGVATLTPLLTDRGRLKLTGYAQRSLAEGSVMDMESARLLLVGFEEMPAFHAETAVQAIAGLAEGTLKGRVESVARDYVSLSTGGGLSPFAVARLFEKPETLERVIDALRALVAKYRPTHLALPAVLGAEDGAPAVRAIREATGLAAFELVPHSPSVPGLRLHRAIERALDAAGIVRIAGEAVGARTANGRVDALRVTRNGAEEPVAAKAVVLAGGKFLGGGIRKDRAFSEPVFDLPVYYRNRRLGAVYSGRLLGANPGARHPLFSVGLRVDDAFRPLDEGGAAAYENLFAAGWILGGYDFIRDGAGLGLAAVTGALAGRGAREAAA
ncbi:MAG: hypothetical protein K8I02_09360, partial [Candidatus Methylomirabilis sp.]|nr:hypothetical protein [Deltaproteobacteria bacterium]